MIGYSSHITRRPEGSAMPASTDTTPLVSVAMRPFLMMSCCLAVLGQENLVQEYWINVHILMRSLKQLGNLRLLSEKIYVWFVRFLLQGWNANTLDQHRSELGLLGRIATRSALDPRRANGNNLETDKTKHVLCVFFSMTVATWPLLCRLPKEDSFETTSLGIWTLRYLLQQV